MDAESRAAMLNSMAAGETMECPNCGAIVPAGKKFCRSCGYNFALNSAPQQSAPVAPAKPASAFAPAEPASAFAPAEPASAFAPAEEPMQRPARQAPRPAAFENAEPAKPVVREEPPEIDPEPTSAFALGLPSWSIVPPQTMVRRHKK